jgi:hypothetical protein
MMHGRKSIKLHNLWTSKIISKQFYNTFIKSQYIIIFIGIKYTIKFIETSIEISNIYTCKAAY